jgi:photosystem II stability/assembly factor-like uncharacterized protein
MTSETDGNTNEDYLYGLGEVPLPDAQQSSLLFAARASGLYVSINGKNWASATQSLDIHETYSATAVAVSPDFQTERSVFLGMAGGILYSENGGQTWNAGRLPSPPPVISCLAVSPNYLQDGILLAGTLEDGVLRSSDRGQNWISWNFGLLDLGVMCLAISPDFAEDETVFAGTESGLFRSTNGGRAWREVSLPFGYDPVMCLALSPAPSRQKEKEGVLFVGTEGLGLFCSNDGGEAWKRLGEEQIQDMVQSILVTPESGGESGILVVVDGSVLLSWDGGQVWEPLWADITAERLAVTVLAQHGLQPGKKAWLGLVNGDVETVTI